MLIARKSFLDFCFGMFVSGSFDGVCRVDGLVFGLPMSIVEVLYG